MFWLGCNGQHKTFDFDNAPMYGRGGVEEKEFAAMCPWLGVSRDFSFY